MERVLITGATGFLGGYLVGLLTKEYQVYAMGRNRERGRELEAMGAIFCPGDFTDPSSCERWFEQADYVIHGGALSSVWGAWEDFYRTNVLGTRNVCHLCLKYGIRRLVFVSSPSIYTAARDRLNISEEDVDPGNHRNDYIKSKILAEKEIRRYHEMGLETVVLRPRGLIGVGDPSLVPRLLRANGETGIPLFCGGRSLVDLTSVENAALACRLALTAKKVSGGVFNITNGEPEEFKKLLEQFLAAIGEKPRYRRLPFPLVYGAAGVLERIYRVFPLPGEPALTRYTVCTLGFAQTLDITRAKEMLGYRPEKTLAQSIREYGEWWKGEKAQGDPGIAGIGKPGQKNWREVKRTEPGGGQRPVRKQAGWEIKAAGGPGCRIKEVRVYHCGYCVNNLGLVFKKHAWEKRRFPAAAVLIRHEALGYLLYDTGYSAAMKNGGLMPKLYGLLNPYFVGEGDELRARLQGDGIDPRQIRAILLSHAHPDHMGGLRQFDGYELMALPQVLAALRRPRPGGLVFPCLLPAKGQVRRWTEADRRKIPHFLLGYFDGVYDLLGDGSLLGIPMDGHSRGQMGLYLPEWKLLFAADACWGRDLITSVPRMRLFARWIQEDFGEYERTLNGLCRLKRDHPEIRIHFSHQTGKELFYE